VASVTRTQLAEGGGVWSLRATSDEEPQSLEWTIDAEGLLTGYRAEGIGLPVALQAGLLVPRPTRTEIGFTVWDDRDPIREPDIDRRADPVAFGLPPDFPLDPGEADGAIDYRAYVEDALDVLQAYHWDSANVDWTAARAAALDGLSDDVTADQAYARIQRAIGTFDPFSTVFVRPTDVPPTGSGGDGAVAGELPAGERIDGVGVIVLPSPVSGGAAELAEYLAATRVAMAAVEADEPACGWVVDLRDHAAGGWGPPIWAMGGLLGEDAAVTFSSEAAEWGIEIEADGTVAVRGIEGPPAVQSPYVDLSFTADSDAELVDAVGREAPYLPAASDPPVAILVGPGTASGGEQAVVAFLGRPGTRVIGGPTAGQPIVAPNLPMADGATLRVPIWVPVDGSGTRHSTNIMPDEVIGDTRPLGSDAVLDAAVEWLEGQAGCS
jgi:hypothetical protein